MREKLDSSTAQIFQTIWTWGNILREYKFHLIIPDNCVISPGFFRTQNSSSWHQASFCPLLVHWCRFVQHFPWRDFGRKWSHQPSALGSIFNSCIYHLLLWLLCEGGETYFYVIVSFPVLTLPFGLQPKLLQPCVQVKMEQLWLNVALVQYGFSFTKAWKIANSHTRYNRLVLAHPYIAFI